MSSCGYSNLLFIFQLRNTSAKISAYPAFFFPIISRASRDDTSTIKTYCSGNFTIIMLIAYPQSILLYSCPALIALLSQSTNCNRMDFIKLQELVLYIMIFILISFNWSVLANWKFWKWTKNTSEEVLVPFTPRSKHQVNYRISKLLSLWMKP